MNFNFQLFLDTLIGQRELFHTMECHICGFDEVYFQHPITKKQLGIACEGCNFVYVINSEKGYSNSKTFFIDHSISETLSDYDRT